MWVKLPRRVIGISASLDVLAWFHYRGFAGDGGWDVDFQLKKKPASTH
jgi:hypothetical protein